jgi:hypothetical protein
MPLPAPQPYCRMAPNQSHCAACHAETVLSKAAVPSLPPLQRVSRRVLHRPAHRPRKQPSHQIAIGGYPTTPRGFLPWRLSDAGPQCQLINREWAGIRNPSQIRPPLGTEKATVPTPPSASPTVRRHGIYQSVRRVTDCSRVLVITPVEWDATATGTVSLSSYRRVHQRSSKPGGGSTPRSEAGRLNCCDPPIASGARRCGT